MSVNDGGPAFPRTPTRIKYDSGEVDWFDGFDGMKLRDYFAAKAMQAEFITSCSDATPEAARALLVAANEAGRSVAGQIAFNAYQMADAMIEARDAEPAEGQAR